MGTYNSQYSFVCSAHFISGKKSNDHLSPDYVPSVFKHLDSPTRRRQASKMEAYERRKHANQARAKSVQADNEKLEAERERSEPVCASVELQVESSALALQPHSIGTQTELSSEDVSYMEECLDQSLQFVGVHTDVLSKEFMESGSSKVPGVIKFYTGLPSYSRLKVLFEYVSSGIVESKCSALSLFQQFFVVLMKLRLNVPDQDIAYRFGVSQSVISKNFKKWINVMYIYLQPLIVWPRREEVLKTMPEMFKNDFRRCICIIDCFEVFCERPSDLMARAQTYSNYKHHNTIKFLIATSPQGAISFISRGWGGRVSDKHLTENCGLLTHLQPGDQVLADRGFTVEESVGSLLLFFK